MARASDRKSDSWGFGLVRSVIHLLERRWIMGHCYSLDLRVRVADFVEAGHSCRTAAEHFDVSESFAIKLVRRTRDTGSPAPARQGRPEAASRRPMRAS